MASVLKSSASYGQGIAKPIAFNIEDVQARAQQYLAEVQQEASDLLAQAQAQVQQIHDDAKADGLAAAESEFEQRVQDAAQKLSDQRCRTAIASCEATVKQLAEDTKGWLGQWRNGTVELASRIADKVVRHTLPDSNELLRVWLEESLVAMRDSRELRVLVNPDDFAVAGRYLQQMSKTVPAAAAVEVIPDPEIELGGCVVRSAQGSIDQQLSTQLERLVEQLS